MQLQPTYRERSFHSELISNKFWKYNALSELEKLERCFSSQLKLKILGTHDKFLVCDQKFPIVTSHNMLTSNVNSEMKEVGLRTDDLLIIAALIERFENP